MSAATENQVLAAQPCQVEILEEVRQPALSPAGDSELDEGDEEEPD